LIIALVLHFLDAENAAGLMREYIQWLPAGSYVVLSVGSGTPQTRDALAREYTPADLYNHSPAEITSFFGSLKLIDPPGLVDARDWDPVKAPSSLAEPEDGRILAGVACKPRPVT
jgi:hypothetical protein